MKKFIALMLAVVTCFSLSSCFSFGLFDNSKEDLTTFYEKVSESQELLDIVADDIYSNWYDAIYEDAFYEDINLAIASAQVDNEENLERIEALDAEIAEIFKEVKETDQGDLCKDIMSAYSDYYEFVVNVSGSFKSYSAEKETLKKELASLLKDLSYEI